PCLCRCRGSRTPCCATTAEPLVGGGLWSSCLRLLLQDLLGCRAIPIPTGCALRGGEALEPWPCATLGAGMERGMVHGEQVRWRCQRRLRRQKEQDAPLGPSGVSVSSPTCDAVWCAGRAPLLAWNGLAADKRLVSPSPRALQLAALPPHLWSALLGLSSP